MKIYKHDEISIEKLVDELRAGKVIVYPTETCYGLGADATNQQAVDRIFAIKQRQKDKPVLVIVPNQVVAMEYVKWSDELDAIARLYWPGPLTVVAPLQNRNDLADGIVGPDNTLAFRITSHPFAADLSRALGKPIVSTSANIASEKSSYDIETIIAMFEDQEHQPDIIIDAGALPEAVPSTIVRVLGGEVRVIRQGEIRLDADLRG